MIISYLADPSQFEVSSKYKKAGDPVVSIFDSRFVALLPDGNYQINSQYTLAQYIANSQAFPACADVPFISQPAVSSCSGILIQSNLVGTASGCVSQVPCTQMVFIFGYEEAKEGQIPSIYQPGSVYFCNKVIDSSHSSTSFLDFAVIKLDRSVAGISPVSSFLQFGDVQNNLPTISISNPNGLPKKWASNATIIEIVGSQTNLSYPFITTYGFVSDLDGFAGSYGSPVFDANHANFLGILVATSPDYKINPTGDYYSQIACATLQTCDSVVPNSSVCYGGFIQSICVFSNYNSYISSCTSQKVNKTPYNTATCFPTSIPLLAILVTAVLIFSS